MEKLQDYRGKFAQIARDATQSREVSTFLRFTPCSKQDLKMVVDEISEETGEIAMDDYGPWFLWNLVRALLRNGSENEVEHLLTGLMTNDVIMTEKGFKTMTNILDLCPINLVSNNIVKFLFDFKVTNGLLAKIFYSFNQVEIEGIFKQIASNLVELADSDVGNQNLCFLIKTYGAVLVNAFGDDILRFMQNKRVSNLLKTYLTIPQDLGGTALAMKLSSHYVHLSMADYSHYFVQACFQSAEIHVCLVIAQELEGSMGSLVSHRNGNYVVQKLIRRFKKECLALPPRLVSLITFHKGSLQVNRWVYNVLYEHDKPL